MKQRITRLALWWLRKHSPWSLRWERTPAPTRAELYWRSQLDDVPLEVDQ